MLGPYRVTARRHDAVGIYGILQRFLKPLQSMIIEGIHIHHGFLEHRRRAIFTPPVLAAGSSVTGVANMKMKHRSQKHAGKLNERNSGMSSSRAASLNTRFASMMASPVRGTIGENHI